MVKQSAHFYFTKVDPDYSIKGSRDPLAFQVLWQHQARKLIPYLSTVSVNLNDFQILCLAYFLYDKKPDVHFVRFFLRFEQLMGYVRFNPAGGNGFNGVDGIRRKLRDTTRVSISNAPEDEILSNQRAYGIWGKYNRPFNDMKFTEREDFGDIFREKVESLPDKDSVQKVVKRTMVNERTRFELAELQDLKPLLLFTRSERKFYRQCILKVQGADDHQNQLFDFITDRSLPDTLELYSFLKTFSKSLGATNGALKDILEDITATEKLLCPLNRLFRYLQTRPIWGKREIQSDDFISKCKRPIDHVFHGGSEESRVKNHLNQSIAKENWSLVQDLANRNKEVSEWREGAPWITIKGQALEVHHGDGGFENPDFDPEKDFDNGYFIDTYLSLYRQIQHK